MGKTDSSSDAEAFSDIEESKSLAGEMNALNNDVQGEFIPKDAYQLAFLRTIPNASRHFPDKIDKDVILANLSEYKKNRDVIEELSYLGRAIEMTDNLFIKKVTKTIVDERNEPIRDEKGVVKTVSVDEFDDFWLPVRNTLLSEYKFKLTSTRALGKDREAVLGKSNIVQKQLVKNREVQRGAFGLGNG